MEYSNFSVPCGSESHQDQKRNLSFRTVAGSIQSNRSRSNILFALAGGLSTQVLFAFLSYIRSELQVQENQIHHGTAPVLNRYERERGTFLGVSNDSELFVSVTSLPRAALYPVLPALPELSSSPPGLKHGGSRKNGEKSKKEALFRRRFQNSIG
jgi:hypothetical protein